VEAAGLTARYDSLRDANDETRRERNDAFGQISPEPDVPDAGLPLWNWFWDLRAAQPQAAFGPATLSHQEILAWVLLTGNRLHREEVAVLKAMDAGYCRSLQVEADAIRAREAE
jgi:hypothetical protein